MPTREQQHGSGRSVRLSRSNEAVPRWVLPAFVCLIATAGLLGVLNPDDSLADTGVAAGLEAQVAFPFKERANASQGNQSKNIWVVI